MKRLLFLLFAALPALASDLVPYGVEHDVQMALYTQDDPPALVSSDPTFQAADCNLIRDGAAAEACDNTPVWETNGVVSLTLSAAETAAENITVVLSDDSGTAFLDQWANYATYNNSSANHAGIGVDVNWDVCIEDADTCLSAREIMCVLLAEAAGRGDYTPGTSTWVVADPSNTQTRLTLVYGTDDGDRTSSTIALTDC